MNHRLRLKEVLNRLKDAVRKLCGRNEYRLHFYKGVIQPDVIDTNTANVLGQALINIPEQIQRVDDIRLDTKNNLIPIEPPDSKIRDGIKPVINTIQNYLKYFRSNLTITAKEVNNGRPHI